MFLDKVWQKLGKNMRSYTDIYNYDKGRVNCGLCDVLIPDNYNCINEHIEGKNHRSAYNNRLALRNSINLNVDEDEDYYCRVCDEFFFYFMDHINSKGHKGEMEEIFDLIDEQFINLPFNLDDKRTAICTICNCNLNFRYYDLEIHINGNRHCGNRSEEFKSQNGIFGVQNDSDRLWCKICYVYFDADDLYDHIDDSNHNEALNAIENLIEDENIDIQDYLTILREDKAFCEQCNVPVPCSEQNLYEHINGYQHCS